MRNTRGDLVVCLWATGVVRRWDEPPEVSSGQPQGPLPIMLSIIGDLASLTHRPVFLTSTRRPTLDPLILKRLMLFRIAGLKDEHISTLVRNWYYAIYDKELTPEDASRIAPKLFGHPMAARLVAGLLGDHSVDFLEQYPSVLSH